MIDSAHAPGRGPSRVQQNDPLSPREEQILELVAGGERTYEIARGLGISENTVKSHLTRVYKKLGVRGRVQATRLYLANRTGERSDDAVGPDLNHLPARLGMRSRQDGAGPRHTHLPTEDPLARPPAADDAPLLDRQIEEIRSRLSHLARVISEATRESDKLEAALAAMLSIKARSGDAQRSHATTIGADLAAER